MITMNELKLKEGMNILRVEKWGYMHLFVKNGSIDRMTVFNAKKKKVRTVKAGEASRPSSHYVELSFEVNGEEE